MNAPIAVGIAMNRFTYRHHRHESHSVRMPPSSSPNAAPPPAMAPKMPNALARSDESTNVVLSSPSAEGASMAPNAPCSAGAATSTSNEFAAPPMAEAMENPSRPPMKVHLRPNMSPMRPPSSRSEPNASA